MDDQGHLQAELKSATGETSLVFFDDAKRERLTLTLGKNGVAIAMNGRDHANQIRLASDDALRTSSIFIAAGTAAINLVGTSDAQLKISDSVATDSRSAALGVSGQFTRLQLASDGAEAQLLTASGPIQRRSPRRTRSVEMNMRTALLPEVRLRVSSDAAPILQVPVLASKKPSKSR